MPRGPLLSWPNRLTLLRIILIGPFVVALLNLHSTEGIAAYSRQTAAVIFLITLISDGLDGYLARKWKQESPLGRFLDPVADKLLMTCGVILLGINATCITYRDLSFQFPSWVIVAAIGKDIFVVIGFLLIFIITGKVFIQPTWSGKSTTVSQMLLIFITLMSPDIAAVGPAGMKIAYALTRILWTVSAALALITCWDYYRIGQRFVHLAHSHETKRDGSDLHK